MLLLEDYEEAFKDVHIEVEHQSVEILDEIPVHVSLFKSTSRDFFREKSCTSNVIGKYADVFLGTKL